MTHSLQIIAPTLMPGGHVHRMIVEVEDKRIVGVAPAQMKTPRADAVAFGDDTVLLPGFHDAHLHLLEGGLRLGWVNFSGVKSKEEFADVLSTYARENGTKSGWIEGAGLDEVDLKVSREEIDKVCPGIPVFIWSHDYHTAFVNSAALIAARFDGSTKNPDGGKIERDALGKLNGVLRETATRLVQSAIPLPDKAAGQAALNKAQVLAFSLGITTASASVRDDLLPFYFDFVGSSDQKIRLNIWRVSKEFDFESDRFEKRNELKFRFAAFKGFIDGALGSRTAAFWEPYLDDANNSGIAQVREGPLARYVRSAHKEGFQVALHAIGDRANTVCLDAMEMASASGSGPEHRPRIEHVQHLREKDISRFAELGVIASMQPIHCTADMRFVEQRLGQARAKFSYAWRSLLEAGAILAFGSDWPIETLDPLTGIHAAVTRQDKSGLPEAGWYPEQSLTVSEAISAYTEGSAYAAKWENLIGTIEQGKIADLVVLSKNIMRTSPKEILNTSVLMTVSNGKIVYRKS